MITGHPDVREIITKAVCGHGTYKYQRSIDLEVPVGHQTIQVLGTFVSNSALEDATVVDSSNYGKAVQVKGHYDVHVWYAHEQETRSAKTTVTFLEYIPIKTYGGESITNPQAFAKLTQKPGCRKAYLKNLGNKAVIRVEIEQNLAAEVVGFTKLKVGTAPAGAVPYEPIKGIELTLPQTATAPNLAENYYYDLKCEEDLPEEDEEEFDTSRDEFDG